jgi:Resolvase, N terminal domain
VLVVAGLDGLARSLRQLLTTVDALKARGIGLRSLHENIDTTSATGRLILHVFAALGQFDLRWIFCVFAPEPRRQPAAPVVVLVASPGVERQQGHGHQGSAVRIDKESAFTESESSLDRHIVKTSALESPQLRLSTCSTRRSSTQLAAIPPKNLGSALHAA